MGQGAIDITEAICLGISLQCQLVPHMGRGVTSSDICHELMWYGMAQSNPKRYLEGLPKC